MQLIFFTLICLSFSDNNLNIIFWPVKGNHQTQNIELRITKIGHFGLVREPRPGIPEHYHSGIDIKRPNNNCRLYSWILLT